MTPDYDTPIEVTRSEYEYMMKHYQGVIAGRESNGRYFIKVWLMKYFK